MNISPDEGVKLDNTTISLLANADDIVVLGNDIIYTVESLCVRNIDVSKKIGLQIHEGKTEYMEIRRQRNEN